MSVWFIPAQIIVITWHFLHFNMQLKYQPRIHKKKENQFKLNYSLEERGISAQPRLEESTKIIKRQTRKDELQTAKHTTEWKIEN